MIWFWRTFVQLAAHMHCEENQTQTHSISRLSFSCSLARHSHIHITHSPPSSPPRSTSRRNYYQFLSHSRVTMPGTAPHYWRTNYRVTRNTWCWVFPRCFRGLKKRFGKDQKKTCNACRAKWKVFEREVSLVRESVYEWESERVGKVWIHEIDAQFRDGVSSPRERERELKIVNKKVEIK